MITDISYKHYDSKTAIHFACLDNNFLFLKQVIQQGIDINYQDHDGQTALYLTMDIEMIKILLEAGANPNLQEVRSKFTPLLYALLWAKKDKFDLLVNHTDLNLKTSFGFTALMFAAKFDDMTMIEVLINAGADMYSKNNEGEDFYDFLLTDSKKVINTKYPEYTIQRDFHHTPASTKAYNRRIK